MNLHTLRLIPRFGLPYNAADFLAALGGVIHPRLPSPAGFAPLLGDRPMFWTGSGRQALWLLLRALGLPAGSRVATPLYNDASVATAIRTAGYEPVFVDVEEATMTMSPAALARVRHRVSAVVVTHFFGQVAHLDQLLDIAGGLPLLEDTAHAPLSFHGGRMVGTFGTACFYSFASTKYWPAGGGGLAVVQDPALAGRMVSEVAQLTPAGRLTELVTTFTQAAKAAVFGRALYGLLGRPTRATLEHHALLEPNLSTRTIQRGQAAVALRQVSRFSRRVEQQRANSLALLDRLRGVDGILLPQERPGVTYNYYLFPVVLAGREERDATLAGMLERHVDSSRVYFDSAEKAVSLGYRGGCPVGEGLAGRTLTLPNQAGLSPADLDRVADAFRAALTTCRASARRPVPVPSAAGQAAVTVNQS